MGVTNYIWDVVSDNVLMEKEDEGETIASYVQKPELHGEIISQERDGQTRYYNFDGEGNASELTDEDENVTDTYEYSAFGKEVARTGSTENPFGYRGALGYYTNGETGDLYVRARTYRPLIGRWLSSDPIFSNGNLYSYVTNRPVTRSDPSGLKDITLDLSRGDLCPCPCLSSDNDCVIDVAFLAAGTALIIKDPDAATEYRRVVPVGRTKLSNTYLGIPHGWSGPKDAGWAHFSEYVAVLVRVRSLGGKDIRNCLLQQNIVDSHFLMGHGSVLTQVDPTTPEVDMDPARSGRNLYYGGYWLYDEPGITSTPALYPTDAQRVIVGSFFQANDFVIGNPSVYAYWGFYAIADFASPRPPTMDALKTKKTWGPTYVRRANILPRITA